MFTNNRNAIYKNDPYVRCSECFREWLYANVISNVENTVHLIFLFLLYKSSKKLSTSAIL